MNQGAGFILKLAFQYFDYKIYQILQQQQQTTTIKQKMKQNSIQLFILIYK